MLNILSRLSAFVMWLLIGLVHLSLAVIALALCWLLGITAHDIQAAYLHMRQTMPFEVLTLAGLSSSAALGAWLWMLRKIHKSSAKGWMFDYLMRGS